ncbi:hypothetical protein SprV_0301214100 [Sparganum proliferum]
MQTPMFHREAPNETLPRCSLVHKQHTDFFLIPASTIGQTKADGNIGDVLELDPNVYNPDTVQKVVTTSATDASIISQTLLSPGEMSYQNNAHGLMISNPCLITGNKTESRGHRQTHRPTKQSAAFLPRPEVQIHMTKDSDPNQTFTDDLSRTDKILPATLENPFLEDGDILLETGTEKLDLSSSYLRLHPISGKIDKKSRRRHQVFLHAGLNPAVSFVPQIEDSLIKRQQPLTSTPGTGHPTSCTGLGNQEKPIQVARYDIEGTETDNEVNQHLSLFQTQNSAVSKTHETAEFQVGTSHTQPTVPQCLFYDCNSKWCSERDGTVNIARTIADDTSQAVEEHSFSIYPVMKEVR